MRVGWSRVTSLSNSLLIPSFSIFLCAGLMTSPASDDHGAGREYQFHPQTKEFEWLGDQPRKIFPCRAASTKYEPEVTSVKRRRGRPRKEAPAPSTAGTPVSPVE
ncbi:hypothetical protein DY000_02004178 [Brassica cretica]|uniref:Secreted protein n=1 Tax=Brassica cretica TaxID=69181 RepID=A0ABQ7C7E1_BRACR|nr:hypothetical protein DY000_02004178 [Brassica cretica]